MNQDKAHKINSAAISVYMHRMGVSATNQAAVDIVKKHSVAQIETASEYVEAENMQRDGTIRCFMSGTSVARVKEFALNF